MSHARARRAIEVKLGAWADAKPIEVAYGLEPFQPPQGQVYLRGFLIPASATSRYLASDAIEYRGIYQISIVCPSDTPISVPEGLIDGLSDLFMVDSQLARAGFEGIVLNPASQGPTINEPNTYTIPLSITYLGQAPKGAA